MRNSKTLLFLIALNIYCCTLNAQQTNRNTVKNEENSSAVILTGAERTDQYLSLLKNKKVALIVNQTSVVNGKLLPDTLLKLGVHIVTIFSPEHGFRGNADAGAHVKSGVDAQTGLSVISLYGDNKKPTKEQLKDIDVLIYDIQDVGARFYTYISTLQYAMEACAENKVNLLILDRPNPLGFVVDGPVMNRKNRSFVGMQSIPVIYGMTPGEYAQMLVGEKWVRQGLKMTVIPCEHYTHQSRYSLPVAPSPNLKSMAAIYLYPSLCLFEGTVISVGRGTLVPFQQYGHPDLRKYYTYSFKPQSMPGATDPPLKDRSCYGELLATNTAQAARQMDGKFQIKWLMDAYHNFQDKDKFFNDFFGKLAGNDLLRKQIETHVSESDIRKSWEPDLVKFRSIRKKYLLYAE